MKIWNLVYTRIDTDDPLNADVKVYPFVSGEKAEEALAKQYEDMLKDIENGATVLDCVKKENNGTNASIQLGYEPQNDWDDLLPEVETQHEWHISMRETDVA